ncbi:MAG: PAS domain S-box protein [Acidobacteria bacterium]|nr:PAS domain S-box protein [Acidobacteriota bacterium]
MRRDHNSKNLAAPPDLSILQSPDLLARILEIADDAIISVDTGFRICVFNQGAAKIFGYAPAEVLGQPLTILLPARFRNGHDGQMAAFARSPTPSRVMAQRSEIFGLRKDGREFPAEASISKVDLGGVQLFTVILRDVSESRHVERTLRAALQDKEILLREVHHRVKNNLQVISSLLSLQARATQDEEVRRAFDESQHRIQSMALIHEQLYESTDFSDVDFPEYIRQLAQRLFRSYQVRPGRVELETSIGDVRLGVDVAVPCGLIVNELLSNSLKHGFPNDEQGLIRINVESMPDKSVLLTVSDNGVGLPPEIGFWSTKTLGLRLVRSLVRQLDGEIELEGPPGAEFRIRFSVDGTRE